MASAELTEHVRLAFAKARRKLAAARRELAAGDWEEAAARAYYAAYHAVDAALRVEGVPASSHEGLKMLFGRTFIESGMLPRDLGRALSRLKDERENGDYSLFSTLDEPDATEAVQQAARLVEAMAHHVRGRGLDPGPA